MKIYYIYIFISAIINLNIIAQSGNAYDQLELNEQGKISDQIVRDHFIKKMTQSSSNDESNKILDAFNKIKNAQSRKIYASQMSNQVQPFNFKLDIYSLLQDYTIEAPQAEKRSNHQTYKPDESLLKYLKANHEDKYVKYQRKSETSIFNLSEAANITEKVIIPGNPLQTLWDNLNEAQKNFMLRSIPSKRLPLAISNIIAGLPANDIDQRNLLRRLIFQRVNKNKRAFANLLYETFKKSNLIDKNLYTSQNSEKVTTLSTKNDLSLRRLANDLIVGLLLDVKSYWSFSVIMELESQSYSSAAIALEQYYPNYSTYYNQGATPERFAYNSLRIISAPFRFLYRHTCGELFLNIKNINHFRHLRSPL